MRHPWSVAETVMIEYDDHHRDDRSEVFVQWKGTDVCFDFWCDCGQQAHYDGYFAYQWECRKCGTRWVMPSTVYPAKVDGFTNSAALTGDEPGWEWDEEPWK